MVSVSACVLGELREFLCLEWIYLAHLSYRIHLLGEECPLGLVFGR
jgi:hypothetical protein